MPLVSMPSASPSPGSGRVVLATTDGPMDVAVAADSSFVPPGRTVAPTRAGDLCVTPCVADLPFGKYRLFFASKTGDHGDSDDIVVGEGLTVYERAPGRYTTPSIPDRIAPALALALGVILVAVGANVGAQNVANGGSPALGLALAGGGIAIGAGSGFWLYDASRATVQHGSTTTWRER